MPEPNTPSRWSSRPWQWALTALLVAAVPCLLAWPRGTVRVAGALVGVTAVVVGLQMLNAERRAATCPGEAAPNPSRCPFEGCRHHCAAHHELGSAR